MIEGWRRLCRGKNVDVEPFFQLMDQRGSKVSKGEEEFLIDDWEVLQLVGDRNWAQSRIGRWYPTRWIFILAYYKCVIYLVSDETKRKSQFHTLKAWENPAALRMACSHADRSLLRLWCSMTNASTGRFSIAEVDGAECERRVRRAAEGDCRTSWPVSS